MKILIAVLLCILICVPAYARKKEVYTIAKIVEEVGPRNYSGLTKWFKKNFKYKKDRKKKYEWREVPEALSDGFGDCEEYSQIALECLKLMGYKDVFLLGVTKYNRNFGHVVTIFREDRHSYWMYFDFEKIKIGTMKFKDLPGLIGRRTRYGSKVKYQLADIDMVAIAPEAEDKFGIHE